MTHLAGDVLGMHQLEECVNTLDQLLSVDVLLLLHYDVHLFQRPNVPDGVLSEYWKVRPLAQSGTVGTLNFLFHNELNSIQSFTTH